MCATLEYETDTGYGETEFKLFDLTVALRNDIKLSDKERVRITLSPTART